MHESAILYGITAITITRISVNTNLQWKYLDDDSSNPAISKIINSNNVSDSANVMEKIS